MNGFDFETRDVFGHDAVIRGEARKHDVRRRQALGSSAGVKIAIAVSIDRQIANLDIFAGGEHKDRATPKRGGCVEDGAGLVASDFQIVNIGGERDFAGDFERPSG